jgi:hypothetical protein
MFIPKPQKGVKIFGYDVNYLYPSVMLKEDFPIGSPTYLEFLTPKDLRENLDLFGFFFCKITAPDKDNLLAQPTLYFNYTIKLRRGVLELFRH